MNEHSSVPHLTDMVEAIEHVRAELTDVSLEAFERDWRRRWIVERGVEIISEASRRLPDALKARHAYIPWSKVAGIGNVLRHEYHSIAPGIMWALVQRDLLPLEETCRAELATALAGSTLQGRNLDET